MRYFRLPSMCSSYLKLIDPFGPPEFVAYRLGFKKSVLSRNTLKAFGTKNPFLGSVKFGNLTLSYVMASFNDKVSIDGRRSGYPFKRHERGYDISYLT